MTKRYLITGAQSHAPVNRNMLKGLEQYASDINAEILVLPLPGYTIEEDGRIDKKLAKFPHIDKRTKLNNNLVIRNFDVRPQRIEPTTGLSNIIQKDESTIFASTKQRLKVIPNSNTELPKALVTTGVVTQPRYRDGFVVSKKAEAHHTFGAIRVDIEDDDSYHFRQFRASTRGRFSDLDRYYDGDELRKSKVKYFVPGDIHVGHTDPVVEEKTYELVDLLDPDGIVLHDLFDGYSINRFKQKSLVKRARGARDNKNSLEEELETCYDKLHEMSGRYGKDKDIYVVACNHHDKLNRYLEKGEYHNSDENVYMGSKLLTKMIEGEDPVKAGLQEFGELPKNVQFLKRNEDLKYRGFQLGSHGDKGPNGAWSFSVKARERAFGRSITMHSHTPEILRDTYVGGTSTYLDLDYTDGPSSWMNTHAVLFKTGKAQLINIIDGEYRSEV